MSPHVLRIDSHFVFDYVPQPDRFAGVDENITFSTGDGKAMEHESIDSWIGSEDDNSGFDSHYHDFTAADLNFTALLLFFFL